MSGSSDEEEFLLTLLLYRKRRRNKRSNRQQWVRPVFSQRLYQGAFHHLVQELRLSDPEYHFRYFRMSKETFDFLVSLVEPGLARRGCSSRERPGISPAERVAVTLRFLASGDSQTSLAFAFRMGRSTVCTILQETCTAIWQALQPSWVKVPANTREWGGIANQFERMWNFPNCVGALDGKHVVIQAPSKSGSTYFNYKGTHSIVLMAVCDAHYRFTMVDVGDSGRHSDGGVLANSAFGKALLDDKLPFPDSRPLPGTTSPALPYVIVADEAFPLRSNMLCPYPGRNLQEPQSVFNYRLSRARRTIENTFGILAARWRIFHRPIIAEPQNAVLFTKATIALHNLLRERESAVYCPPGYTDSEDCDRNLVRGAWRDEAEASTGMTGIQRSSTNMHTTTAAAVRTAFQNYFYGAQGSVSWQLTHVRRTS